MLSKQISARLTRRSLLKIPSIFIAVNQTQMDLHPFSTVHGVRRGAPKLRLLKSLHLHFSFVFLLWSPKRLRAWISAKVDCRPNILIPCRIATNRINMSARLRRNALHCDQTADCLPFLNVQVLVLSKCFDYVGFLLHVWISNVSLRKIRRGICFSWWIPVVKTVIGFLALDCTWGFDVLGWILFRCALGSDRKMRLVWIDYSCMLILILKECFLDYGTTRLRR